MRSSRREIPLSRANDRVRPARQILELAQRFAAHGAGLKRQHDPEFGEQAVDAIDRVRCAAVASFLSFLPDSRYGATNLGAINVWPCAWNRRTQWVRARARLHADQAGCSPYHQFEQLAARSARTHQHRLAHGVHAMQGEHILGEIDPRAIMAMDFPFRAS